MKTSKILTITLFCCLGIFANEGLINDAEILSVAIINAPAYGHSKSGFEISIRDNITWPSAVGFGNAHEWTSEFGQAQNVYRINVNKNVEGYKDMLATVLAAKTTGAKILLVVTDDQTMNTYGSRPSIKIVQIK